MKPCLKLIGILFVVFGLAGCAQGVLTRYSVVPVKNDSANRYNTIKGGRLISVLTQQSVVSVCIEQSQINENLSFVTYIAVKNKSQAPIIIKPEYIWFEAVNDDSNTKVGMIPYSGDELVGVVNNNYNKAATVTAVLGALNAAAAAINSSVSHRSASVSGTASVPNGGSANVYGYYSETVYNPAAGRFAAALERHKTDQKLTAIEAERARVLNAISAEAFRTTSIEPDGTYIGMIQMRPHKLDIKLQSIKITVKLDGEEYPFTFAVFDNHT
ncbi:MAG: hypothetical protein HQL69_22365 [Magnetococcales bacterium]|nr:hypothetical protein [Magnetococcales bacterium]